MLRRHRYQCALGARNDRPLDHCKLWLTLDTLLINYGTVLCCLFRSTMLYCLFLLMYLPASRWECLCVCVALPSSIAVYNEFWSRRAVYCTLVYVEEPIEQCCLCETSDDEMYGSEREVYCVRAVCRSSHNGRCCARNRFWFPFGIGGGAMWAQVAIDNNNNKAVARLVGCMCALEIGNSVCDACVGASSFYRGGMMDSAHTCMHGRAHLHQTTEDDRRATINNNIVGEFLSVGERKILFSLQAEAHTCTSMPCNTE